MEKLEPIEIIEEIADTLFDFLMENYWGKISDIIESEPKLPSTFPTFLIDPENVIFYIGKNHWAVEYTGNIKSQNLNQVHRDKVQIFDYSTKDNLLNEIFRIDFSKQTGLSIPLQEYTSDFYQATNEAAKILADNGWNFTGESLVFGMNLGGFSLKDNKFSRIVNSFFYGANENGLITRSIKWLDIFPLIQDENESAQFTFWPNIEEIITHDANFDYPVPQGYREEKWSQLNRFVELISSTETTEPEITKFLSQPKNLFILKMALNTTRIFEEKELEWQTEVEKKPIRPDFFIERATGFCDIAEFKLPYLKNKTVVGKENRETFSAEVQSYISQTRDYEYYFEDPNNKRYAFDKYGVRVEYPKRILVMGRRWMLDSPDWRRLEHDNRNITIKSYDEIIDLVLSHLYS